MIGFVDVMETREGARGRGFIQEASPIQSVVSTVFTWSTQRTAHTLSQA